MKRLAIVSLFIFSIFCVELSAQLPDGSIAPNWTLTDLDGNEHTLYTYLDSGMTVVIDFSATWCPPCWSYHNSGNLENLYESYGPEGTGEVMVFFIEGDATTDLDDLHGTGDNTQGDWVSGTPYPIINSSATANDYEIAYWPTIYMICQNRTITEIGQQTTANIYEQIQNCPQPEFSLDCSIENLSPEEGIICADSIQPEFTLINNGTITLNTLDISYSVDGGETNVYNWTGVLPLYYSDEIELPVIHAQDGIHTLNISVSNINGEDDQHPENSTITSDYNFNADGVEVRLFVQTDNTPAENSWKIEQNGELLIDGGNYDQANHLYQQFICLDINTCFDFILMDSEGDGMGSGYISLKYNNEQLLRIAGNDFTTSITEEFCVGLPETSTSVESSNDLIVYPNPAREHIYINASSKGELFIYGITGKEILHKNVFDESPKINIEDLQTGSYFIRLLTNKGVYSGKFTVIK